ncbi:MAG TPA: ECF-type sigma factor [Planctomycetota bacterium]|nr:ECF-type sigma factor [Planctomycetota bacterium]
MVDASARLTEILSTAGAREDAWRDLLPLVYDELRLLARGRMAREKPGHVLEATALVHEAWMKLAGDAGAEWSGRRHFFGAASRAMQQVLVDHARQVRAERRGGGRARLTITLDGIEGADDPDAVLALDEALEGLAREDPRAAEVARLRIFAGLDPPETARSLDLSERTVLREWAYARARLAQRLAAP